MATSTFRTSRTSTGSYLYSEVCWDGLRRFTACFTPPSKNEPEGRLGYRQRWVSMAMMNALIDQVPNATRGEVDYL